MAMTIMTTGNDNHEHIRSLKYSVSETLKRFHRNPLPSFFLLIIIIIILMKITITHITTQFSRSASNINTILIGIALRRQIPIQLLQCWHRYNILDFESDIYEFWKIATLLHLVRNKSTMYGNVIILVTNNLNPLKTDDFCVNVHTVTYFWQSKHFFEIFSKFWCVRFRISRKSRRDVSSVLHT